MPTAVQALAAKKMYGGESPSSYLEQEVYSWSPEKIILKSYDLFIVSAKRNDSAKMNRILTELINSLNFDYDEPAIRLYRLYEYCQTCVNRGDASEAINIIQNLRTTWSRAFNID